MLVEDLALEECSRSQADTEAMRNKKRPSLKNMSVFLLGIDSTSFNHLKRALPLTYAYMSRSLANNVFFEKYHSVAENTYGNVLALLTGLIVEANEELNVPSESEFFSKNDDRYHDIMPFVW